MPRTLRRLKRRADFLWVARTRRRCAMPGLVLQVRRHTDADPGEVAGAGSKEAAAAVRVGFTVSRKVGNAVQRNRARRRLRAAADAVLPVAARPGHTYVLIGRKGTLTRPWTRLLADLDEALRRCGAHLVGDDRAAGAGA
ncbi:MAG TPA: ribonuclease P protein component [Alphaproteobacteria bacterium]|jgi:ribonuclease P protein component|nr:ribonuclease P protein component [Alphaproteobacteria bacterium]